MAIRGARNQDCKPREIGEVTEITWLLDLTGWPEGSRVIVRRERPHPVAQLSFTDSGSHRFQAILTDQTDRDIAMVGIGLMHARGASNATIAELFGVTDRQVRRIIVWWECSPLRLDTEEATTTIVEALKARRDDMDTLGITAAAAAPEVRIKILAERVDLVAQIFKVTRAAGVNFESAFNGMSKDPDLVTEVNAAIRTNLIQHGVATTVIDETLDEGLEVYADWDFPIRPPDRNREMSGPTEKSRSGHESRGKCPPSGRLTDISQGMNRSKKTPA